MSDLPVVVIGAGPTGLAAAAHLRARGIDAVVLEAGPRLARQSGSGRTSASSRRGASSSIPRPSTLLDETGWQSPALDAFPTGGEWAEAYLQPLADALGNVRYNARVVGVAKTGRDLMVDAGRDTETFTVHVVTADGEERVAAQAVLDASGTWTVPNPLGTDGCPALGEVANAERITYRVPDFADSAVAAPLSRQARRRRRHRGIGQDGFDRARPPRQGRREHPGQLAGPTTRASAAPSAAADEDQLERRGELGKEAQAAVEGGPVQTLTGFRPSACRDRRRKASPIGRSTGKSVDGVDEIIVLTGFRPDLSMLSEIRLDLDSMLQAPAALAPMIDPNVHSCGTVEPHGAKVLAQPDARLLPGRDEELRTCSVVPHVDRLRAGPLRRRRDRRRPRRRGARRARLARHRSVRRRPATSVTRGGGAAALRRSRPHPNC